MQVIKDFTFDAAHRLVKGYQGKCQMLHGHTYKVEVLLSSTVLDQYDMVINFDEIKSRLKAWVDEHWDHATILNISDTALREWLIAQCQKHYVLEGNPTAEKLAHILYLKALYMFPDVAVGQVRVWETPTSSAVCTHE